MLCRPPAAYEYRGWHNGIVVIVRRLETDDYPFLQEFLYQAIYVPPGEPAPDRSLLRDPEISVYIDGFGHQRGDLGVIAESDGRPIGAAWARRIPGYGHIDANTPELAISVIPEFRGRRVGTKLMGALFTELTAAGEHRISLSVQTDNPAVRFYERLGFQVVNEQLDHAGHEDFLMVKQLGSAQRTSARDWRGASSGAAEVPNSA